MKITLRLKDAVPDVRIFAERAKSPELMLALGTHLVRIAQGNFSDAKNRPATWPARKPVKKGGGHALLKKSGELFRSLHVSNATAGKVSVGTPAPYGAIHQFGGKIQKTSLGTFKFFGIASQARQKKPGQFIIMPARPYFPIKPGTSQLTGHAERALQHTALVFLKNGW